MKHTIPKNIRLLALDLDGTILTKDKRFTERTKNAVQAAAEAGIAVVYATGRPRSGVPEEILLPGVRYVITSNGAVTTDLADGRTIRASCISPEIAREISKLPGERKLIHSVFIDGIGYCEPDIYAMQVEKYQGTFLMPYVQRSRAVTEDLDAQIAGSENGVENIWFIARSDEEQRELNDLIRKRWDVRTVFTIAKEIEVGSPGAEKGLALRYLAESLGIGTPEIMAIGDNENDLGMLQASGFAVAMGNATEAVRRIAQFTTGTNEEDGAAAVIERMLNHAYM